MGEVRSNGDANEPQDLQAHMRTMQHQDMAVRVDADKRVPQNLESTRAQAKAEKEIEQLKAEKQVEEVKAETAKEEATAKKSEESKNSEPESPKNDAKKDAADD